MTTSTALNAQSLLAGDLRQALGRLNATLHATPADKLDFKPSETAKSIREIAQHALGGNGYCMGFVGLEPIGNPEQTEVEALIVDLEASVGALADYAAKASDETLATEVDFFGSKLPIAAVLQTAEWHVSRHAGQIDYIQTIYGDLEDHR